MYRHRHQRNRSVSSGSAIFQRAAALSAAAEISPGPHRPESSTSGYRYVIGDNKTGGALCLRHLHALGHQRICFVSSARRNTFTVRSRIDGILQEAKARNIPESSITILDFFNKHQPYVHYQKQMMKLIREERITAFIAAESTTCAYLYSLFATMNLRVPEDISLMSFDKPLVESQHPDFFTHIQSVRISDGKRSRHDSETSDRNP
ncbi:MAG: substrate-binding domain-containing protein [Gallintestinimicrobium sp.]